MSLPLSSSNATRRRAVLGIQTEWKQMKTTVNASQHTWIPLLPYDIYYFVGATNESDIKVMSIGTIISLPVDDHEYPPINKTFAIWSYFFEKHILNYDYFVVIDADTYVNVEHFDSMMKQLTCRNCYVGFPATGEPEERKYLDLRAPYCLGMGYIIAHQTLSKFGPHINVCRESVVARHSDTELGRCIYRYADRVPCTRAPGQLERVRYTINSANKVIRVKHNDRKQLEIDFPKSPPTLFFRAAMVHPIKKSYFICQFHRQVTLGLRPILPRFFATNSCVANSLIQQEVYPQKAYVPECTPSAIKVFINISSLNGYVITLPGHDQRVSQLQNAFRQHGIWLQRFDGETGFIVPNSTKLKGGAWGLRLTMTRFFQMALTMKLERVLVLEDDAIPHRQFGAHFQALIDDRRCGGYMHDDQSGGVLMLGATIWASGWRTLDKYKKQETGLCRNIGTKTFGSFAALFHRTTFEPILTWLNTTHDAPYDFVFNYLARLGYPVRLAMPNLVITDVTHMSLITNYNISSFHDPNRRARIHRWNLTDYMFVQYL